MASAAFVDWSAHRRRRCGWLLLWVGALVGCQGGQGVWAQTVPLRDLGKHRDQTVMVRGSVQAQAPFVGGGAYRLVDASGAVWVVTGRSLPAKSTELRIQGLVKYQAVPLGDRDWGEFYLQEIRLVQGDDSTVAVTPSPPADTVPSTTGSPGSSNPPDVVSPVKPPKPILNLIFLPHR
jgi:hypothetical protein